MFNEQTDANPQVIRLIEANREGAGPPRRSTDRMFSHCAKRIGTWARPVVAGLAFSLLAAGCASPRLVTLGPRAVPVLKGAATELKIDKLWSIRTERGWEIRGYVLRSSATPARASDHVDVVQLDANNQIVEITHVPVAEWKKQPRLRSKVASFQVALAELAASTVRIEVLPR